MVANKWGEEAKEFDQVDDQSSWSKMETEGRAKKKIKKLQFATLGPNDENRWLQTNGVKRRKSLIKLMINQVGVRWKQKDVPKKK
mmetsp:Transcript_9914/g.18707  ORF Transcript_9914/g.18707 Transcript_9914/m.18707 type:complete len:85 (-) Transcript_9914:4928-5182(-)